MMRLLWSADTDRARLIFQQAQFELSSATGEDLERFRNARLQDLGFEPVSEAISVYSVIPLKALRTELEALDADEANPSNSAPAGRSGMVADLVLHGVEPPDLLRAAVAGLEASDRARFGNGFAYLANKVFMAESGDLSRLDELPEAARQAAGLANLGLSYLAQESEQRAAEVVTQVTPETLFQAGWTMVHTAARKARRLAGRSGQDRDYWLFGSPTDEVILAMSALRPRYPEELDDPTRFGSRPISTLDELTRLEARIDEASLLLDAFEHHFGLTLQALEESELPGLDDKARKNIRLTTLVRTGLLHFSLSDEFRFTPVTRDELVAFSRVAFNKDGSATDVLTARLRILVDSHLEGEDEHQRQLFADLMSRAVDELVESLGSVHEHDIDLRYAGELFLVVSE
jgi:hypothetical protein